VLTNNPAVCAGLKFPACAAGVAESHTNFWLGIQRVIGACRKGKPGIQQPGTMIKA
jgi:hypothetical protein